MSGQDIPFNRASVVGEEFRYMAEAIARGKISGDGEFSRRCHALLERELGAARVLLTTSCTHALEMCALLLDLAPGDEVIIPSFTFVSTVNAFVLRGARPVFADIRPDTLNLDERRLGELVGPRTRALVAVHYAGIGCEMGPILDLAARHGLTVIEDNAHGLFGRLDGRLLGSFGALSTLSFHETKNFTCGEGGALVINDPRYIERAEIVREKGTNRSQFFRGMVDRYTWVDLGSSYLPSDVLAAFLFAQLEARRRVQAARQRLWNRYRDELAEWAAESGARLPHLPPGREHPAHIFYLIMPSLASRQALIDHLKQRGILAVFHYVPLHLSPQGQRLGRSHSAGSAGSGGPGGPGGGPSGPPAGCPVAADLSDRLLRLPLFYELSDDDQTRVIEAVRSFPGR